MEKDVEEKIIFESKSPEIVVTTKRIVVGGKIIPAATHECIAAFASAGILFKKNEFYIAYSHGDNVFRQGRRIDYCMTIKSDKASMLREYDVSLYLVSTSLAKGDMDKLKSDINQAVKKASALRQAEQENEVQSEIESLRKLDKI